MKDIVSEEIMRGEEKRQRNEMELIASENYVSADVREAMGCVLTNKYAEGYPGKRYYAGQEFTDKTETLAIERTKKVFHCQYANVQPLSGAAANTAVYLGLLNVGDKLVGMSLPAGGHLSHGAAVNCSSKFWASVSYGVDPVTGLIDYDEVRKLVKQEQPKLLVAGFSAYPRTVDWKAFKSIADEVGAMTMADIAHISGLVAAKELENPLDCGFDVMTTTTHKTLRGPRGGIIMTNNEELAKKIDKAVFPGLQGGPHMNNVLAKAVALWEADQDSFRQYGRQVIANAKAFSNALIERGAKIITGGTENHIVVFNCVDSFGVGGKAAQLWLEQAGLSTNKNSIPGETRSPFDPSGIRLGTAAMTTRGFGEKEFVQTAEFIALALRSEGKAEVLDGLRADVAKMCASFPTP